MSANKFVPKEQIISSKLKELKSKLIQKNIAGVRIVVDKEGSNLLSLEVSTLEHLGPISIIQLINSEANDPGRHPNANNIDKVNEFNQGVVLQNLNLTEVYRHFEGNWQAFWNTHNIKKPLISQMSTQEYNQQNELYEKIALLPFGLSSENMQLENDGIINFMEGVDNEDGYMELGAACLKAAINTFFADESFLDGKCISPGPVIDLEYANYQNEVFEAKCENIIWPNNYDSLLRALDSQKALCLTGFASGTDRIALELLKHKAKEDKNVLKIKVYSRENIRQLIEDFSNDKLICTSIVLRDFFDPIIPSYKDGFYDVESSLYYTKLKAVGPHRKRFITIVNSKIIKEIYQEQYGELYEVRDKFYDILNKINKSGNYVIFTSSFDIRGKFDEFFATVKRDPSVDDFLIPFKFDGNWRLLEYNEGTNLKYFNAHIHNSIDLKEPGILNLYDKFSSKGGVFKICLAKMFISYFNKIADEMIIDNGMPSKTINAEILKRVSERINNIEKSITLYYTFLNG